MDLSGHRLGKMNVNLPALALALAIGALGGMAATLLHLPLGMLLGSLIAVALTAIAGWRPFGIGVAVPARLRFFFVPVIGVSVGGAFTYDILRDMAHWWPSMLALLVFLPLAQGLGYLIFTRIGGVDRLTAYFGAVPGGLIESVALGEQAGADPQMLTLLQFLRLILCIILVPLGFTLATGHAVGSASGVAMTGASVPLHARDVLVLVLAGALGWAAGRALRFPAAVMTGPILFSALAHLGGLTQAVPPGWAVALTQLVVGTSLGVRFAGLRGRTLRLAFAIAALNAAAVLGLAMVFALTLAGPVREPAAAVFLAFAPGGLAEMGLVALSLQMSVVYVTAHHVARIVLSVLVAQMLSRRLRR